MDSFEDVPETQVLTFQECWRLLLSSSLGRLAVTTASGPEIFPVNYLPEESTLILRTGPGTKLEAVLEGGPVALEADGLSSYGTIAWSVVVKGHPAIVPAREQAQSMTNSKLFPWEPGFKEHLIRITPTEVSGRRFAVSPPRRWWSPRQG